MFKKIDHVEIVTNQPDRTIQFYTEVLGFCIAERERVEHSSLGVPMNLVYLHLGGTAVELISYEGISIGPAPENEQLGYHGMALETDNMQKAIEYLKAKGVAIVWGPLVKENHYARAEILDPNGYHIELRQWFHKENR